MTLDEYNALKVGDKVTNADGHMAEVVDVSRREVRIRWCEPGGLLWFSLPRVSTIWYGFNVVKPERDSVDTAKT